MFDLDRFVNAQESIFELALAELQSGLKKSHWMWFIFPQLRGLGQSPIAWRYGLVSLAEARAYLDHSLLWGRLRQCVAAVLGFSDRPLRKIFGSPDDIKFRSSMTLFALACEGETLFMQALDCYCSGSMDAATQKLLGLSSKSSFD